MVLMAKNLEPAGSEARSLSRGFGWVGIERMKAPSGEVRSAHSGAEKLAPHKRRDIARKAVAPRSP